MGIRTTTLYIVGVTFLCLLLALFGLTSRVLLHGYESLESQQVYKNNQRALGALQSLLDKVDYITTDWAGWDETYRFVLDGNKNYADTNLSDTSIAGIDVDFIGYFQGGRTVFATGFDSKKKAKCPVPRGLLPLLQRAGYLDLKRVKDGRKGYLELPQGVMMVAARPIITSTKQGPVHGTLVCGHVLGDAEMKSVAAQYQLKVFVHPFQSAQLTPAAAAARAQLVNGSTSTSSILDENHVAGYAPLQDVFGRNIVLVEVLNGREVYQQGRLWLTYFVAGLVLVAVLFFVVVSTLLDRLVISRIKGLEQQVSAVTQRGDIAARVVLPGTDEISALGHCVNELLDMAEAHQKGLRQSEARFRSFMDNSPLIAFIWEPGGKITFTNLTFREQFLPGSGAEEVLNYQEFWPPEVCDRLRKQDLRVLETHLPLQFEAELPRSDETPGTWLVFKFPLENELGEANVGSVAVDITERKLIDRMKSEFVSMVNHELRTPITAIRGALGLVQGGVTGVLDAGTINLVDIAARNCDRLNIIINDILDIERIEMDKMPFQLSNLELMPMVHEAVNTNQPYAAALNVRIEVTAGVPGALVATDDQRFMQVLANLLSNAAKFSVTGALVRVMVETVEQDGVLEAYRISVHNEGPPVPLAFRSKIFSKFAQADASDTRQKGGTGLGLSISKAIVERLGGTIGYRSEAGEGTTFFVTLPAVQPGL